MARQFFTIFLSGSVFVSSAIWAAPVELEYNAYLYSPPERAGSLSLENQLFARHGFGEQLSAGLMLPWSWEALSDPALVIRSESLFASEGWNLEADLRTGVPLTSWSRQENLIVSLGSESFLSYENGPGLPFFEVSSYLHTNFYSGAHEGQNWSYALSPGLKYQWSDALSSQIHWSHSFHDGYDALIAGMGWDVISGVNFTPQLHLPLQGEGFQEASFRASFNWILF